MYATKLDGQSLTLGVSGMLWEGSLVMVDEETESLWSHLLGACMKGPLVGKQLEVIPSLITDWESWKNRHADTSLVWLPRTANLYRRQMIKPDMGLGIGLVTGDGKARLWDFGSLNEHLVINDDWENLSIVVFFDPYTGTASIFSRLVDGKALSFLFKGEHCIDKETESSWDTLTGIALSGPLQGEQLTRLPGIISDGAAWEIFHPHGTFWQPEAAKSQ